MGESLGLPDWNNLNSQQSRSMETLGPVCFFRLFFVTKDSVIVGLKSFKKYC